MSAQDYEQLTLFPADSPASRSVQPGSAEALQMTVSSGLKCCELYRNSGPLSSLVKMLLASPLWQSRAVLLEWRAEALPASRTLTTTRQYMYDKRKCSSITYCKTLKKSATRSSHLLFRLVPLTPRTGETESPLWPTATTDSARPRRGRYAQGGLPLAAAVNMFPTPTVFDATGGELIGKEYNGTRHAMKLIQAARMTPYPAGWGAATGL